MGKEIEKKFLVISNDYKDQDSNIQNQHIKQGYFADGVRVRTSEDGFGKKGFITFKSPKEGMVRTEYEYEIPYNDAEEILNTLCKGPIIKKIRHVVYFEYNKWEIDEFFDDNKGLIVAELEMGNIFHKFTKPKWLGKEVTDEKKYYNSKLTETPYKNWK